MSIPLRKPLSRERTRIGADQARWWVRQFTLRNPYAKAILMAVANYMNEDGAAWPGLSTIAQDTDITEDTISARLRWCESIGMIVVLKCWVDENGRRNYEKRGRPTSSEIRYVFDADIETVEANAKAAKGDVQLRGAAAQAHAARAADHTTGDADEAVSDSDDSAFSDRPGRTLTEIALPPGSTQLAPEQPPPGAVRSLNLESQDSPPNPPPGGAHQPEAGQESEADWPHAASWQRVETAWNDPILHQGLCRTLWSGFTEPERERFPRVIRGYLAWRLQQPKPPNRCNIQKLMRERDAWPGYEKLAGPDPALRTFVIEKSREDNAYQMIALIGGWMMKPAQFDETQGARGYWRARPIEPDELAMAQFVDKPFDQWTTPERNTPSFFAWSDRLRDWTGQRPERMRVPIPFPPRKDGSTGPPPSPP